LADELVVEYCRDTAKVGESEYREPLIVATKKAKADLIEKSNRKQLAGRKIIKRERIKVIYDRRKRLIHRTRR
jgi:hypothetical protein